MGFCAETNVHVVETHRCNAFFQQLSKTGGNTKLFPIFYAQIRISGQMLSSVSAAYLMYVVMVRFLADFPSLSIEE